MKKGYIKKDQRKKILLLGDDLRTPSGVGTQSKNLVLTPLRALLGHPVQTYFICFNQKFFL